MKTVSLVLFLVASALSAEDVKPVEEVKEVKAVPQARALLATPLGAAPYQPLQQQFGARIAPYYQPQNQYLVGQQHTYIHGAPAQTYVSGSPYYNHGVEGSKYYQSTHGAQYYHGGLGNQYYQGALGNQRYYQGALGNQHYHQDGAYYPGAPAHFVQPASVYHTKKVVQPVPAPIVKTVVPAPATVGVHHEYERFAAPAVVRAHAAAPVPAHIVKTVVPAPATVGVHHEYERFAAPAVVRAHAAAPAHIVKAAHSVPAAAEPFHAIVKQANDDNFDGSFAYSYETDHGIAVESTGYVKNAGTPDQVQVMQGSYTYYTPEGVPIITTYIADENGFQVQGDHLPVAPPMPEAIAKSIEYQRSLPPSAEDLVEQERAKAYAKY